MEFAAHAGTGGLVEGIDGGVLGFFEVVGAAGLDEVASIEGVFGFVLGPYFEDPFEGVDFGGDQDACSAIELAQCGVAAVLALGEGGFEFEIAFDGKIAAGESVGEVGGAEGLLVGGGGAEDIGGEGHDEIAALGEAAVLHDGEELEVCAGVEHAVDDAGAEEDGFEGGEFDGFDAVHGEEFDLAGACEDVVDFGADHVEVSAPTDQAIGAGLGIDLNVGQPDATGENKFADVHCVSIQSLCT